MPNNKEPFYQSNVASLFIMTSATIVFGYIVLVTPYFNLVFSQEGIFYLLTVTGLAVPVIGYFFGGRSLPDAPDWYKKDWGGYPFTDQEVMSVPSGYPKELREALKPNPFGYGLGERIPDGAFSARSQKGFAIITWMYAVIGVLMPIWLYINTEMKSVAVTYALLALVTWGRGSVEEVAPKKSYYSGFVGPGYGEYTNQILLGLLAALGVATVSIFFSTDSLQIASWQILTVAGQPAISAVLSIFMVPFIEEGIFGNLATFSLTDYMNWALAAVITGLIFAGFHQLTYGSARMAFFTAFLFRVPATFLNVKYKSMLPGWAGHTLINAIAFLGA